MAVVELSSDDGLLPRDETLATYYGRVGAVFEGQRVAQRRARIASGAPRALEGGTATDEITVRKRALSEGIRRTVEEQRQRAAERELLRQRDRRLRTVSPEAW